ncbi:thiaminase II [Snodgrassella alvi]|uniref:thiaminase II n=1 Tax=Snodgrassella alvi TaxID=1196083 RepID=UPI000C1EEDC6|nr:thiaminase II [Snodgrassella alvi]PIT41298.1 thiaminase II [Snodgrassella alvi]
MSSFESLIEYCKDDWNRYIQHDFVQQLGKGILDKSCFQHYLKQDYLFLIQFSRAWGLAVYKSHDILEIRQALASLKAIVEVELDLHVQYCKDWGISKQELDNLPEAEANVAYTRYMLDAGQQGDLLDLHIALAPCLIGYGVLARWIEQQSWHQAHNNPYQSWIDMYTGEEFHTAMEAEIEWINQRLANIDSQRFQKLAEIFSKATQLEADFWQMGLNKSY